MQVGPNFFLLVAVLADLPLARALQSERMPLNSTSLPQRLAHAVMIVAENLRAGSYSELHCPKEQELGLRPPDHTRDVIGSKCEAWIARGMLMVLEFFLDPSMRGLEWSSGSGSIWSLRRLRSLHSVEHDLEWLNHVKKLAATHVPHLYNKWTTAGVACVDVTAGACSRGVDSFGLVPKVRVQALCAY